MYSYKHIKSAHKGKKQVTIKIKSELFLHWFCRVQTVFNRYTKKKEQKAKVKYWHANNRRYSDM